MRCAGAMKEPLRQCTGSGTPALCHAQDVRSTLGRDELFAALVILGFANGTVKMVSQAVSVDGLWAAGLNTFGISGLVWAAVGLVLAFLARQPSFPLTRTDLVVAGACSAMMLVPFSSLSWVALTSLALYIMTTSDPGSPRRKGAVVLLALTVPMFWSSRVVFALFSDLLLEGDAILASWIIGTDQIGNTVGFADGSGYLYIAPGCSSLANVSLAILTWAVVIQLVPQRSMLAQAGWCLLACLAVILINVTRIGLIGLYREHYDLLHGPIGETVANWLTLAAILGLNVWGVRRELVPLL
jgi:exosortase/archaeosortase family protein